MKDTKTRKAMAEAGRIKRQEVRLSGFGGQGIILAGHILGKAVALFEGKNAVFTQSYGPEARGGACNADVIISEGPIHYPKVTRPDVLVFMSEEAKATHGDMTGPETIVIIDEDLVRVEDLRERPHRLFSVPATRIAEVLGRRMVANIVMLGYLSSVTRVAGYESLKKAILSSVPKGTEELNSKAFERGFQYGEETQGREP
jgi:2-oxoglutarate ferredoxin oxidoreductase subunit gamma